MNTASLEESQKTEKEQNYLIKIEEASKNTMGGPNVNETRVQKNYNISNKQCKRRKRGREDGRGGAILNRGHKMVVCLG